ncbi:MAG TPA: hypothetical protein VE863_07865 [Pyrinomonadaceae bacterium]|nr:hypothetical protein [Pyrinomonadaceae bacterium]
MNARTFLTACLMLITFAGATSSFAQTPSQTEAIEKIKAKVIRVGMGQDVTVKTANRDEYHGTVQGIEDTAFKIYEVDLRRMIDFKYSEVAKVQSGYGHSRDLTGARIPPRKHQIGLALGLAVIIVPVIIVVASLGKH